MIGKFWPVFVQQVFQGYFGCYTYCLPKIKGLVTQKALHVVEFMFFGNAVLMRFQEIKNKVLKFTEFVFGASEIRHLGVEYPSVCCIALEDVRQVVNSCNNMVHGRVVRWFGFIFLVFKEKRLSLSVWLMCGCYNGGLPYHRIHWAMQQFEACIQGSSCHHIKPPAT